jgi:hypothetical protein
MHNGFLIGRKGMGDMATFESVRQRSYDILGIVQEKLRSDWVHDVHGPDHEQIQALEDARRHLAAAKAALARAARTPHPSAKIPESVSTGSRRFGLARKS